MKIVKRILIISIAGLLVLSLLLVASVVADFSLGRDRILSVTNTVIPGQNGAPEVRAFVALPEGAGPFPVVIMIHEFFGLNESILGKARALASEGYLVVAPDTFRGSTTAWIPRAIYQVITTPAERVNQDLDAVFTWLEANPQAALDRVGIVGFCYGGRVSLSYSLHNPRLAATVIFYGAPETDPAVLSALPGPVLGIFGGADQSIPLTEIQAFEAALNQAGIPNEITIYPGQPHAFVSDITAIQSGGAAGQAWEQMLRFLDQNLKQNAPSAREGQAVEFNSPFAWQYYLRLVFEHARGAAGHAH